MENTKVLPTVIISIVALMILASAVPVFSAPQPEKHADNWLVIYNTEWDKLGAQWISDEWGAALTQGNPSEDYNGFFQNIVFVGNGKHILQQQTPWIADFQVVQPTINSQVKMTGSDPNLKIVTPENEYVCDATHQYFIISVGFDIVRQRYVIVVLGFSGFASVSGARALIENLGELKAGSYMVGRYTGDTPTGLSTEEWLLLEKNDFPYQIIEIMK